MDDFRQARLAGAGGPQDDDRQVRGRVLERLGDAGARARVLSDEQVLKQAVFAVLRALAQEASDDRADVLLLVALGVEVVTAELP